MLLSLTLYRINVITANNKYHLKYAVNPANNNNVCIFNADIRKLATIDNKTQILKKRLLWQLH